jgi:hypothetical protein
MNAVWLMVLAAAIDGSTEKKVQPDSLVPQQGYHPRSSDIAVISNQGSNGKPSAMAVGISPADYLRFWHFLIFNDLGGVDRLFGKQRIVQMPSQTPVKVVSPHVHKIADEELILVGVEVLKGPRQGKLYWVEQSGVTRLVSRSQNEAAALLRSAQDLEKVGKSAEALASYRRIIRDYPGTLEAKSAVERSKALRGNQSKATK